MKRDRTLFWYLFPSYLIVALGCIAIAVWYASDTMKDSFHDEMKKGLKARAYLLEHQIETFFQRGETSAIDSWVKQAGIPAETRITVIDLSGKVIGDSDEDPANMENHGSRPEIKTAMEGSTGNFLRYSGTLGIKMLYVAIPVTHDSKIIAVLRASMPVEVIDQTVGKILKRITVGAFFIAILFVLLSFYVSKRISRPVVEIEEGVAHLAGGDLDYKLRHTGILEIKALVDAINDMAEKLKIQMAHIVDRENELKAVFSAMTEGVIALDSEEHIVRANESAAEMLNKTIDELENMLLQESVRNTEFHARTREALSRQERMSFDVIFQGDAEMIIEAHASPLFISDNERNGVVIVMNDVTRFRRLERIRKDFTANISHELRTPLTAVGGFLETLMEGKAENEEDRRRFLKIIQKHVMRLMWIAEETEILANVESQKERRHLDLRKENVSRLMTGAVDLIRDEADKKNVSIVIEGEHDISAMVNKVLFHRAAFNLLENAVNFSPNDSGIVVRTDQTASEVRIIVEDQGAGISKDHIDRIFERFYRVDPSRSRNSGGAGLGLAVARHIVEAHNGRLSVESRPGKGSTFIIQLPKSESSDQPK